MKTSNKVLMSQAREALKGKWGEAVGVTFIYGLITIGVRALPVVGTVASLIITGPFMLGLLSFWLLFSRKENPKLGHIFSGFTSLWRGFKAYLLLFVFTFLWSLLLVIPGIIAAFSYSQTYYILIEDKNIGVNAAINKSKVMMKGNKWKLFCLELRFLGWAILCIPTLGIGFLWLIPYVQVASARFYDDIKDKSPEVPEVVSVPTV